MDSRRRRPRLLKQDRDLHPPSCLAFHGPWASASTTSWSTRSRACSTSRRSATRRRGSTCSYSRKAGPKTVNLLTRPAQRHRRPEDGINHYNGFGTHAPTAAFAEPAAQDQSATQPYHHAPNWASAPTSGPTPSAATATRPATGKPENATTQPRSPWPWPGTTSSLGPTPVIPCLTRWPAPAQRAPGRQETLCRTAIGIEIKHSLLPVQHRWHGWHRKSWTSTRPNPEQSQRVLTGLQQGSATF